jgi:hypothetical protein
MMMAKASRGSNVSAVVQARPENRSNRVGIDGTRRCPIGDDGAQSL